ncbi:unnamed protein product [Acanthoscelides obtectus]|uniref:Uncharacterized protein n=1 Tax=Acanthoscelides obtectus TaxID=200917 RepID=A0A9P0K9W1_ACAOB|nr:unnamed protein product [Acanthoscelides obtectus]CAK1662334.1 hypothetical protein AOBTE_LOCUS23087 [Acanthoscelides obtectus]
MQVVHLQGKLARSPVSAVLYLVRNGGFGFVVRVAVSVICDELFEEADELLSKIKRKERRSCWERSWVSRRSQLGGSRLLDELAREDKDIYRNVLHISRSKSDDLLDRVKECIQKKDTKMRVAIPSNIKLEITLRHLLYNIIMVRQKCFLCKVEAGKVGSEGISFHSTSSSSIDISPKYVSVMPKGIASSLDVTGSSISSSSRINTDERYVS